MGIFGLTFERYYPVFGFEDGCRAMSSDEILQMQFRQQAAMQNAQPNHSLSYLSGFAPYQPPQRPLDERFADFKIRLAAAMEKHGLILSTASPPQSQP